VRIRLAHLFALVLLLLVTQVDSAADQDFDDLKSEARRAYNEKDYSRSAELTTKYYEALLKERNGREDMELATATLNVGKALQKAGSNEDAIPYITKACEIARHISGEESDRLGTCLMFVVEANVAAGHLGEAQKVASTALPIVRRSMGQEQLAAAKFHLGEVFRDAKASSEAAEYFSQAAAMYGADELNNPPYLSAALSEEAKIHYAFGDFDTAASLLAKAIAADRQYLADNSATLVSKLYLLADCYRQTGEYDRSIQSLQQVAAALKGVTQSGHMSQSEVLLDIAGQERDSGGSSEALQTLQDLLQEIATKTDEPSLIVRVSALDLRGKVLTEQGEYAQAQQAFETALDISRRISTTKSYTTDALDELGFFFLRRGYYAEARTRLEQALQAVESKSANSEEAARIREEIATALTNDNDCESARPLLKQAVAIYNEISPKSTNMVRALKISAICEAGADRNRILHRALDLQLHLEGISPDLLVETAADFQRDNDFRSAKKSAEWALQLQPENASAKEQLAQALDSLGDSAGAVRLMREGVSAAARQYGEDSINVAGRYFNLGRTLLREGDTKAAADAFVSAASSFGAHANRQLRQLSMGQQRQLILMQSAVQTSGLLSTCSDPSCLPRVYGLMLAWKGLLVEGLHREAVMARALDATSNSSEARRLRTLRTQLSRWASARSAQPESQWQQQADRLVKEKEGLERQLLLQNPAADVDKDVSLDALQKSIHEDEVLVDIYRYKQFGKTEKLPERYTAIVIARAKPPVRVEIGSAEEIDSAIAQWLDSLAGDSQARWSSLRKLLWAPIKRTWPATIRRARVSPDGELARIPWHAMEQVSDHGGLEVAEVDSPRSLVFARRSDKNLQEPTRLLIIGAVDYDAGRTARTPLAPGQPFPTLKWSEAEAEAIVGLAQQTNITSKWLGGSNASVTEVLTALPATRYVHFSTHGFANGEQERGLSGRGWTVGTSTHFTRDPLVDSGLALSGANVRDPMSLETSGILSAEALLDADLSASRLVVLSACDTGLGLLTPAQGVMGLRSAIGAAGGTRLLLSLWSVDDEATKILMSEFYRNLWVRKLTPVESLQTAQQKVREDPRYRAARFWAGWSVVDAT
jgi:CHAT domain-containing protein/Flp pilus assembly protein TadD